MKRLLAAALCAALPVAAGVALAQGAGDGDGVDRPNSYPFAAPLGKDSGAFKAGPATAVNKGAFNKNTWKYGTRYNVPAGTPLWNPAMIKLKAGGKVYSATVNGNATPEQYCNQANNEQNDFIWIEMQHAPGTWHDVANMWNACPGIKGLGTGTGHAVHGVRIPTTNEFDIQHATDMGAMVVVVPTMDTAAEAREAAKWTFFPPMGRRSAGSNVAGQQQYWGAAPGGYRNTYNQNLVLILMIETLDGLQEADAIAKVPGVSALFAASSDLGNFTGYAQGDADYERAINIVHDATLKAKIRLCGPSSWYDRPDFTCFQGGPPQPGGRGRGGRGRGARGAAPAEAPAAQ